MKKETSEFYTRVYDVVRQVLYGQGWATYGAIAKYLGAAKSARIVGYAMNNVHSIEDVPAHRVVNRIGLLTGKHHWRHLCHATTIGERRNLHRRESNQRLQTIFMGS